MRCAAWCNTRDQYIESDSCCSCVSYCRQKSTSGVLYRHVNTFARNLPVQCCSNLAQITHRSMIQASFIRGSGVRFFVTKSIEALRTFHTSFLSSEMFRSMELTCLCLLSLPRLRSQTRHIPAIYLFILKICTEFETSRGKSMLLVPNLYAKSFCTR